MKELKFAWRSLRRQALFSSINLLGLTLGFTCALLTGVFVLDELKYDRFHEHAADIYRVTTLFNSGGNQSSYSNSATPIAPLLVQEVPEVKHAARVYQREAAIEVIPLKNQAQPGVKFREPNFIFADSSVFDIFSIDFLAGDARSSFKALHSVIITERAALRYFGTANAIGRELIFEEQLTLRVTGVVKEWPDQSHIAVDLIAPFDNFFRIESEGIAQYLRSDWTYTPLSTYVLLQQGASAADVEDKLGQLVLKYADDYAKARITHVLQPLTAIRLYSSFSGDSSMRINNLYIFSLIGALTLLVACFNFINLSVVTSLRRSREAGIKKALGAGKTRLVLQFLTESALVVVSSTLAAGALAGYGIRVLNGLTGKIFSLADLLQPEILALATGLVLLVVVIACLYPSMVYSTSNPVNGLRGITTQGNPAGSWLRRSLLVAQLGISLLLFSATLVVNQQMKFIREAPLGFQKEHMLLVPLFSEHINTVLGGGVDGPLRQRMNNFEEELAKSPFAEAVTVSSALPGQGAISALVTTNKIRQEDNVFIQAIAVDYDYLEAYKMELVAGRSFSREFGTDHLSAFMINEEALKALGWTSPEEAIGESLSALDKEGRVVGVIKNYHFQGLREAIRPLLLEVAASKFTTFTIRLAKHDLSSSIAGVEESWNRVFPEKVFEYQLLDDQLDLIYEDEKRLGTLVSIFSVFSFFISGIGLFGIASFMHLRRKKEIGIRKVLGAGFAQLFGTLSKEFVYITLAAVFLLLPVSYLVMEEWLNGFAYRTSLSAFPFLLAAITCGLFVLLTIAFQTLRSASIDPVEALKHE